MDTLTIVCPHCLAINSIRNAVDRSDILCDTCNTSLASTTPITCDAESFKIHIADNDIPVLVDFYSPDCAPCMQMAPDYEAAATTFPLEVRFLKVNTVDHPDLPRQYGVNQLPTIIAFKKGHEVNRFNNALSLDQLKMWAESLIQMTL